MEYFGNPYMYVAITAFVAVGFLWVSQFSFHIQAAAGILKRLRTIEGWGTDLKDPLFEYGLLMQHLNYGRWCSPESPAKTRISPELIGSSKEELKDLHRRAYRYYAEFVMKAFRGGECFVDSDIFRLGLEQAGLTLADIGTNEAELSALVRRQRINTVKGYLVEFRTTGDPLLLLLVMAECAENGISYEEIGTTRAALLEDMAEIGHSSASASG